MKIGDTVFFVSGDKVLKDILHSIDTKEQPNLYHTNRCSNLLRFQIFETEIPAYEYLLGKIEVQLVALEQKKADALRKIGKSVIKVIKLKDLGWMHTYRDGGTRECLGDDGKTYFIDGRIGSKTKGEVFTAYPSDSGAEQLSPEQYTFI